MALNFRKSIKIAPGVRVNVGKKSTSLSFGGKGLRYSISSNGKRRTTVGIPGSGLSYSTTSGGKTYKSTAYQNRQNLRQQQMNEKKELARYEVELFQNTIDLLKSIHIEADEAVDWEDLSNSPPPYLESELGPKEKEALKALENYKPGFFERLFKNDKTEALEAAIVKARQQDVETYQNWLELKKLSERVLSGNLDAYMDVINEMAPLDDLSEFGSGFEIGCNDASTVYVSFDVHSKSVIPTVEKTLTKAGNLSIKKFTKTKYYELQQDYVSSCIIRIARDMFALLPIDTVYVHAYDEQLNTETGHVVRNCIVSVKFDRATLQTLNFQYIDPSDALNNFTHNMKFRKTLGFAAVSEIED